MSLIVLVGPAGVGKGSVVKELLKHCGYRLSVSATTREPRAGEVDGEHYHFVSSRVFEQMIENAELIEWAKVHGNHYYGTTKAELDRAAAESAHLILEIDLQGARQIAGAGIEHIGIFLEPPSWEELERRLRSRGTETESEIQTRLATAREELAAADEFENRLVNDDLGTTAQRIRELVTKREEKK